MLLSNITTLAAGYMRGISCLDWSTDLFIQISQVGCLSCDDGTNCQKICQSHGSCSSGFPWFWICFLYDFLWTNSSKYNTTLLYDSVLANHTTYGHVWCSDRSINFVPTDITLCHSIPLCSESFESGSWWPSQLSISVLKYGQWRAGACSISWTSLPLLDTVYCIHSHFVPEFLGKLYTADAIYCFSEYRLSHISTL